MKLIFKQKKASLLDGYTVTDENANVVYIMKGELAIGHRFTISCPNGNVIGTLKEKKMKLLPTFDIFNGDEFLGSIQKKFSFLKPVFSMDFCGWHVQGSITKNRYLIFDKMGELVATVKREHLHLADTYVMEIQNPEDSLFVLMFTLAMDAEKD